MKILRDSFDYELHEFITDLSRSEAQWAYRKYIELVLIFENEAEKYNFDKYVLANLKTLKKHIAECDEPYLPDLKGYVMSAFKDEYKTAKALNKMLDAFRAKKQRMEDGHNYDEKF